MELGVEGGVGTVLFRQKDSVQDDLFPGSKAPKAAYEQGIAEFGKRGRVGKKSPTWRGSPIGLSQIVCQVFSCVTLGWDGKTCNSLLFFSSAKARRFGCEGRDAKQRPAGPSKI